ncbi:MAG: chemotaxis protein CheW [Magnetococcales bacterium]|nr:chemotaxis protein CheW [Magnetococcales bacterium]MBF0437701.1 chemotaxis protein CheW [Magnetococcales bacterium]
MTLPRPPRLPDSPEERAILHQRAQLLARTNQDATPNIQTEPLLHVLLGTEAHYGIPYRFIEEIILPGFITPVPNTPALIAGLINLHGQLLAIIDVNYLFFKQKLILSNETRIVVVHGAGMSAGILVESVEGKELYQPDQLTISIYSGSPHIHGIHQGRIAVLNVDILLTDIANTNKNR